MQSVLKHMNDPEKVHRQLLHRIGRAIKNQVYDSGGSLIRRRAQKFVAPDDELLGIIAFGKSST